MRPKKKQGFPSVFLNSAKAYPILTAVAAGLYPLLFYYTNNYKMINSWGHLGYFVSLFLLAPVGIFFIAHKISGIGFFKKMQPFVLPFLNFFFFQLSFFVLGRLILFVPIGLL